MGFDRGQGDRTSTLGGKRGKKTVGEGEKEVEKGWDTFDIGKRLRVSEMRNDALAINK